VCRHFHRLPTSRFGFATALLSHKAITSLSRTVVRSVSENGPIRMCGGETASSLSCFCWVCQIYNRPKLSDGPIRTLASGCRCCDAARQSRHSLQCCNREVGGFTQCGTKPASSFRASLTQHRFAPAACSMLQRSTSRHSGQSYVPVSPNPRPCFRRNLISPTCRGQDRQVPVQLLLKPQVFAGSARLSSRCRSASVSLKTLREINGCDKRHPEKEPL
jgi:hypothetical protein